MSLNYQKPKRLNMNFKRIVLIFCLIFFNFNILVKGDILNISSTNISDSTKLFKKYIKPKIPENLKKLSIGNYNDSAGLENPVLSYKLSFAVPLKIYKGIFNKNFAINEIKYNNLTHDKFIDTVIIDCKNAIWNAVSEWEFNDNVGDLKPKQIIFIITLSYLYSENRLNTAVFLDINDN